MTGPSRHPARSRRDRHGRGLRGRLVPAEVPLARSRAEQFDDLVLDAVEDLERRDRAGRLMTGASVRPRGSGARPVRGAADRPAGPTGRSCRMGLLLPHPHRNAVCLMPTTRVRGYCAVREEPVVRQSRRC